MNQKKNIDVRETLDPWVMSHPLVVPTPLSVLALAPPPPSPVCLPPVYSATRILCILIMFFT